MRNIITLPLLIVTLTGCGYRTPQGFPETMPVKITVLKNGEPQKGVEVSLVYPDGNGAVVVAADTDSVGTAQLQTQWANFIKKGAPIGNAKVTLIKHVSAPPENAPIETLPEEIKPEDAEKNPAVIRAAKADMKPKEAKTFSKKIEAEIDSMREVPKVLSYHKTTPLEIHVLRQKNELTVDLADFEGQKSEAAAVLRR
jgi:hypothetical protein